jgi:hypothetical protein
MWPTRSFVRAALSASVLSTTAPMLGALAVLGECSVAIAGGNVLQELAPVTDEMLQKPDPGDWLMKRGNYRAWGYSALDQIHAGGSSARSSRKKNLPPATLIHPPQSMGPGTPPCSPVAGFHLGLGGSARVGTRRAFQA